ncbi:MAG: ABC transporter substrate-binding protein, partial [Chromatiales bacterium]|nr:ABC transporter substrate-binding protein [Chromatiales bacterium]
MMRKLLKAVLLSMMATVWMTSTSALADEEQTALQRIQERGVLEVAVYADFPPFSYRGERGRIVGIDVDIAHALAKRLGVVAAIRAVGADENMEDDLRNNVWKGHYLGGGVADVMLHTPFDEAFAEENDRVTFIAPYYREQIVFAVVADKAGRGSPLEIFTREKIGVELDTLADFYLLTAYSGRIRDQVVHFRNMNEAVAALKAGELSGVAGPRSEIEFALGDVKGAYAVGPIQMPGMRSSGWDLGAAVRQGNKQLANALDQAMIEVRETGELQQIFEKHGSSYQLP